MGRSGRTAPVSLHRTHFDAPSSYRPNPPVELLPKLQSLVFSNTISVSSRSMRLLSVVGAALAVAALAAAPTASGAPPKCPARDLDSLPQYDGEPEMVPDKFLKLSNFVVITAGSGATPGTSQLKGTRPLSDDDVPPRVKLDKDYSRLEGTEEGKEEIRTEDAQPRVTNRLFRHRQGASEKGCNARPKVGRMGLQEHWQRL